jgi:hypothetical protein
MRRFALALLLLAACTKSDPSAASATAASDPEPASQPASRPASPVPAPAAKVPTGDNRSGIAYGGEDPSACRGEAPCPCVAPELFHGRNALARIGITPEDLAAGTPCLLADFDGNGHTDAAFLGDLEAELHPVRVLFHDAVGLEATAELPKPVRRLALTAAVPGKAALADGEVVFVFLDGRFRLAMRPPEAP